MIAAVMFAAVALPVTFVVLTAIARLLRLDLSADERTLLAHCDEEDERMDDVEDGRCCALAPDHAGICVFRCSMCAGTGRSTCAPDDLGCHEGLSGGFCCDGWGYCPEPGCESGWFTEDGNAAWLTSDELAGAAS